MFVEVKKEQDFSDLIDVDISLLKRTCKFDVIENSLPNSVEPVYGFLKSMLKRSLSLDEKFDFQDDKSVEIGRAQV